MGKKGLKNGQSGSVAPRLARSIGHELAPRTLYAGTERAYSAGPCSLILLRPGSDGRVRLRAKVAMVLALLVPALALAPACTPTVGGRSACEDTTCDGGGGDAPLVPTGKLIWLVSPKSTRDFG